ncbi:hypothetical protein [Haladaptatus paucihalophilus]|uniref:hypothetical protein n=1 Tax=Haladaptatus paucihalophilus TaxID=367189 RepID=UPI000378E2BA|nr:hypothetical protein [Haladaptatus paucihalophilus]
MRVGIVPSTDGDVVEEIEGALGDEAEPTTSEDTGTVLDANPTVVVAVGEQAVTNLVRAGVSVPVLPVDAGPGLESVALRPTSNPPSRTSSPGSGRRWTDRYSRQRSMVNTSPTRCSMRRW